MAEIEKRRKAVEIKRILHFGKMIGPWWRPSMDLDTVNRRFCTFLQNQHTEEEPILRAAFTCMMFDKNRLIAFIPHNGPPFCLLKSDKVALSEEEAAVVQRLDSTYRRSMLPYFSDFLTLPDELRPKTVGKMMIWCVEEEQVKSTIE